jgi:hypothetical protein
MIPKVQYVRTGTLGFLLLRYQCSALMIIRKGTIVADPNPDPSDPYVFGPPGSFYHQAKIVLKNLDSYCFVILYEFYH